MKINRDSKYEFLRLIMMFLIVYDHVNLLTNWSFDKMSIVRASLLQIPTMGGKLGVNIFFLITGYFLIKRDNYRIQSVIRVWLTAVFYSLVLTILAIIFKFPGVTWRNIIKTFLPFSFNIYWFITVYVMLMLIYPILNKLVKVISQREYIRILLTGFITLFIWSSFFQNSSSGMQKGETIVLGIYVYLLGGYIRLYFNKFKIISQKVSINIFLIICMLILLIMSVFIINWLQYNGIISFSKGKYLRFIDGDSPFLLIASSALFILVIKMPTFYNSIINSLSKSVLGIYILHMNLGLIGELLYGKLIHAQKYQFSNFVYLYCFLAAITIFIVTLCIDLVKRLFMNKIENRVTQRIINLISYYKLQNKL